MTDQANLALAERYFTALVEARYDALETLCAPDIAVWHNFTGKPQSLEENIRMLGWVAKRLEGYRYEDVVRRAFPGGFVQQHVLLGRVGVTEIRAPACLVATVRDGRIARIDEYMNSADLGPLNG